MKFRFKYAVIIKRFVPKFCAECTDFIAFAVTISFLFFSTESSPEIRTALSAVSPAVLGYSDRGPAPNHLPHGTCGAAVPVPLAEATSVNPLPKPPKAASGPCTPHPKRWLQGKRVGPSPVEKRRASSPGCPPLTGTASPDHFCRRARARRWLHHSRAEHFSSCNVQSRTPL